MTIFERVLILVLISWVAVLKVDRWQTQDNNQACNTQCLTSPVGSKDNPFVGGFYDRGTDRCVCYREVGYVPRRAK